MANPFTELARLFFRVSVNKEEVKAELRDVEGAAQETAQRVVTTTEQASQSGARSIGGIGRALKEATKPVNQVIAGLMSVVHIFTRIIGLVGLVAGGLWGLVKAAQAWERAQRGVTDAIASGQKSLEQIKEARRDLESGRQATQDPFGLDAQRLAAKEARKAYDELLASAQKQIEELRKGPSTLALMAMSEEERASQTLSRLDAIRDLEEEVNRIVASRGIAEAAAVAKIVNEKHKADIEAQRKRREITDEDLSYEVEQRKAAISDIGQFEVQVAHDAAERIRAVTASNNGSLFGDTRQVVAVLGRIARKIGA